nr:MAG TPA: hypothetical protein [Caudoviricetes sp.]
MSQGQIRDKDKPEGQTRECPYVPEVSLGTRTNPKMSLRNRTTMRV